MTRILRTNDIETLRSAAALLIKENERLVRQNRLLMERISQLDGSAIPRDQQELAFLKELLAKQNQELFGSSSEKSCHQEGAEPADPEDERDGSAEAPAKQRRGHGRREQLQLPVVEQEHTLSDDQRTCPQCQGTVEPMGDQAEVSEEITIIQSKVVLVRHRRLKYRCRCNACVLTAPAPEKLQAGGRYSIAFSVHVAADKYLDHIPLNRQAGRFARMGLDVSPQTLWDQVQALLPHVRPTYQAICAEILRSPVVHADETHWRFLAGDKSAERKRWYAWGISTPSLAAYHILDSRDNDAGMRVLAGYTGTVVADGYRVYGSISQKGRQERCLDTGPPLPLFRLANCWAHVRRKFVEAKEHYPECQPVIDLIGLLFHVERCAGPIDDEAALTLRGQLRQAVSRPLVEAIFAWAKEQKVLPRSLMGGAIAYLQSLKAGLQVFLNDPRVAIDNNAAERALRGMVVGRKVHYGSKSRLGVEVAAVCYTLFESAKLAGVDPVAYVEAVARQAIRQPGAVLLPADFKASCQSSLPQV